MEILNQFEWNDGKFEIMIKDGLCIITISSVCIRKLLLRNLPHLGCDFQGLLSIILSKIVYALEFYSMYNAIYVCIPTIFG